MSFPNKVQKYYLAKTIAYTQPLNSWMRTTMERYVLNLRVTKLRVSHVKQEPLLARPVPPLVQEMFCVGCYYIVFSS